MTGSTNSGRFAITPARAVEDHRLGDAAYRLLACLGTYADKDGWCWPSMPTLAERLGITRQAVQRSIRQLAELGYIEVEHRHRADGTQDRNRYRLLFDRALFEVRNRADISNSEGGEGMQHDVADLPQRDVAGGQPDVAGPQRGRQGDRNVEGTPYIDERTHKNGKKGSVSSNELTAGARPADARKAVYDAGEKILGPKSGGLVTKLLKHCDGDCQRARLAAVV
jgi:DNA-binding MarR family transcriptional regulator